MDELNDAERSLRGNVTAAVVAAHAGVSKWTVIRAFQPDSRIAGETRKRVLRVARELDYQPNLLARSLATSQTHQVAVLVDDFANPFMLPMLGTLLARLQDEGLLGVVLNINESTSHLSAIQSARQRRMDSIVSFGVSFSPRSVIQELPIGKSAPIFVLARESTTEGLPSVYTDAAAALEAAGAYLFGKGYRRPVFVGGPTPTSTALGRRRRYREFWRSRGVAELPEVSVDAYRLDTAKETLRTHFEDRRVLSSCDVLLCENDILAIAALDVAKYELGLDVPGDLAVLGFDDISLASTKAYDLTTVRQPYEKMVDELVAMITGRQAIRNVALPGELVLRSSA